MEQFVVKRTNGKALRFKGELLAEVSSSPNIASSRYSGENGRWKKLTLWKTPRHYVCRRVCHTLWQRETDFITAKTVSDVEQVFQFFGSGWLAQELYEEAGLDFTEEVD